MDMDDIGPKVLEQTDDMGNDSIVVDLAQVELIKVPGPHDDFIRCVSRRLESGSWPLSTMEIVCRREEQRLHIRTRAILAKEIVREDLRPARMKVRMIVGNDQNACRQLTYSDLTAMMTS
jgi:hypothetical protein